MSYLVPMLIYSRVKYRGVCNFKMTSAKRARDKKGSVDGMGEINANVAKY